MTVRAAKPAVSCGAKKSFLSCHFCSGYMLTFEVSPSSNADLTNESHGNGFLQAFSATSDWIQQIDVLCCVTPKCFGKS